jgi:putative acetyltransferase
MANIEIISYQESFKDDIISLIINIQQNEFNVPITAEDQPDLQTISTFYCQNKGNFWLALKDKTLVGTIALIDIGNNMGAIRKMFVSQPYRGKAYGVAAALLDTLRAHCQQNDIKTVYLGTIPKLQAAVRFYEKNGFVALPKDSLPPSFPIMAVDSLFMQCEFE